MASVIEDDLGKILVRNSRGDVQRRQEEGCSGGWGAPPRAAAETQAAEQGCGWATADGATPEC